MPRSQNPGSEPFSRGPAEARGRGGRSSESSCDLLLVLCTRDPVAELLGRFGASAGKLLAAREDLEAVLGPESADWRVRLEGRGGGDGDLEQLLAICRSAESHAYQLLEQVGLQCAALRREIIVLLRTTRPAARARSAESVANARTPSAAMSRARRPSGSPGRAQPRRTPRQPSPAPLHPATGGLARPRRTEGAGSRAGTGPERPRPAEADPRRELGADESASSPTGTVREVPPSLRSPRGSEAEARRPDPRFSTRPVRSTRDDPASPGPRPSLRTARPANAQPRRSDPGHGEFVGLAAEDAAESAPSPGPSRPDPDLEACRVDPRALPPLEGRDRELAQLCDALGRQSARVPLLVGAPGSGRTLLALHVSAHLDAPVFLLAATAYDGEEALARDLDAIEEQGGIALFDDLDRVPSEVAPPFIGALSHAWTRGAPHILTLVSPEGHGRLANWLPGALQTADAIRIDALAGPPLSAAVKSGATAVLEGHGMGLSPDVRLSEVTRWAERYLTGLAMPARALDLLDLTCARTKRSGARVVTREACLEIVAERSGLCPARIEARGDQEILDLEQQLARSVVGHDDATSTIAQLIRRNRAGFGGQRPVLSCLLLGPSGVGKTELAKALASALFDDADALFRLDMSEYSESHAVARVVGAPPGYVGHEQGGALTDPLLRRPHCVVLLDEIEKAHRDVHQLLLQVFDEGRLTDGRGRTVDFRHAVVVMTSNLGADRIRRTARGPHMDEEAALDAARAAFPIELWNRIEAPLVMHPLDPEAMLKICRRLVRNSSDRLFKERGIRYELTEEASGQLVQLAGRDPALGARPLRHLLVREVESVLADAILRGRLRAGVQASVHAERGRFVLR